MTLAARLRVALVLARAGLRPEPLDFTRLPALSLRRPSRNPVARAMAHMLIRLLVLSPMPEHVQVWAALFPVSMLWPLVSRSEKGASGGEGERAAPPEASCSEAERLDGTPTDLPNGRGTDTDTAGAAGEPPGRC